MLWPSHLMQLQLPVLFSFNLHFSANSSSLADDVVSGDAFARTRTSCTRPLVYFFTLLVYFFTLLVQFRQRSGVTHRGLVPRPRCVTQGTPRGRGRGTRPRPRGVPFAIRGERLVSYVRNRSSDSFTHNEQFILQLTIYILYCERRLFAANSASVWLLCLFFSKSVLCNVSAVSLPRTPNPSVVTFPFQPFHFIEVRRERIADRLYFRRRES